MGDSSAGSHDLSDERLCALAAWAETVIGENGVAEKQLRVGGELASGLVVRVAREVTGAKRTKVSAWEETRLLVASWNEVAASRLPKGLSRRCTSEEAMVGLEVLLWCGACCGRSNRGSYIQRILKLDSAWQQQLMTIMKAQMAIHSTASSPRPKTPRRPLTAVREDSTAEKDDNEEENNDENHSVALRSKPNSAKRKDKELSEKSEEVASLRTLLAEREEAASRERDRSLAFEMRCLEAERSLSEAKESMSRQEQEAIEAKENADTTKVKLNEAEHRLNALRDEVDILRPCREKLIQTEKQLERARELKAELREARDELVRADGFVSDAESRALAAETERDKLKERATKADQLEDTIAELRVALEQTTQDKQAITERAEALATLLSEAQQDQEQLAASPSIELDENSTSFADSGRETARLSHRVTELETELAKCDPEVTKSLERELDESRRYAGVWQRTAEKAKSELSKQRDRYTTLERELKTTQHRCDGLEYILLANRAELEENEAMGREERRGVWLKKRLERRSSERQAKALDWLRRTGSKALERQWRGEFQLLREACTKETERRIANAKEHRDELHTYHEALSKTKDECAAELEKADAEIKCIKAEAIADKREALAEAQADFESKLTRCQETLGREHAAALEDLERRAATKLRQAETEIKQQAEVVTTLSEQLEDAKLEYEQKLSESITELEAVHTETLMNAESSIKTACDRRIAAVEEARAAAERLASEAQAQRTELRRQVAEETRKKLEAWERAKKDAVEAATAATAAAKELAHTALIESLSGDASTTTAKLRAELTSIRAVLDKEQEDRYVETEALKLDLNESRRQHSDAVSSAKSRLESVVAEHTESLQSLEASLEEAHEQLESAQSIAAAQDEQHRNKVRDLNTDWTQRLANSQDSLRAAHAAELASTCARADERRHRALEQESRGAELKLENALLAAQQDFERRYAQMNADFEQRQHDLTAELEKARQEHGTALQRAVERHDEILESQARAAEIELEAFQQKVYRLSAELEAARSETKISVASAETRLREVAMNAETRLVAIQQRAEDQLEAERAAAEASKWLVVRSLENELSELQKTVDADREKAAKQLEEALDAERAAFDDRTERLVSEHELALRASIAAMERERVSALKAAEEDKQASIAATKRAVTLQKDKAHDAALEAAVRSARESHAARLTQAEQQAAAEKSRLEELLASNERRHAEQLKTLSARSGDENRLAMETALFEAEREHAAAVRLAIADTDAAAAAALDAMRSLWQRQALATTEGHRDAREAAIASSCAKMYLDAVEAERLRLDQHQRELEAVRQEQQSIAATQLADALREREKVRLRMEGEAAAELESLLKEAAEASRAEMNEMRDNLRSEHRQSLESALIEADAKLARYSAEQAAGAELLTQAHSRQLQTLESRLRQRFETELDLVRGQTDNLRIELENTHAARSNADAELTTLASKQDELETTLRIIQAERDRIQAELDEEREASVATTDEIRNKLLTMRADAAAELKNERESARTELTARLTQAQREAASRLSAAVEEARSKCMAEAASAQRAARLDAERATLAAVQDALESADTQRIEAVDNARAELRQELAEAHRADIQALEAQHRDTVAALEDEYKQHEVSNDQQLSVQIEAIETRHEATLKEQEDSFRQHLNDQIEALEAKHTAALEERCAALEDYYSERISTIEAQHEDVLRQHEVMYQEKFNSQLETSRDATVNEHERSLEALERQHEQAVSALREELQVAHTAELERLMSEKTNAIHDIRVAHAAEVERLSTEKAEAIRIAVVDTEARARKEAKAVLARMESQRRASSQEMSEAQMQELTEAKQKATDLEHHYETQLGYGKKLLAEKVAKIEQLQAQVHKLTRERHFLQSTRGSPTTSSAAGVSLNGAPSDTEKLSAAYHKLERDFQALGNRLNAELARKVSEAQEADDEHYSHYALRLQRLEGQLQEKTMAYAVAAREAYDAKLKSQQLLDKLEDTQLENTRLAADVARRDLGRSTFRGKVPTTPVGTIHLDDDTAPSSSSNELSVHDQLEQLRRERAAVGGTAQRSATKKRRGTGTTPFAPSAAKENVYRTPHSGSGLRF